MIEFSLINNNNSYNVDEQSQQDNKNVEQQQQQYNNSNSNNSSSSNNGDNYNNDENELFINNLKEEWKDIKIIGRGRYGVIARARKIDGLLNGIELGNSYCVIKRKIKNPNVKVDNESVILKRIQSFNNNQLFLKYYHHEIKKENDMEYYYIYTEYFNGETIGKLVKKKKRIDGDENIIYITWKILLALDLLHSNLIMHRDISPNNVLVSGDLKQIKLIDFGTSILLESSSKSIMIELAGTPCFIAPEIINENNNGRKSDIWSLGALVIFMYGYFLPSSDSSCDLEIPSDLPINIQQFLKASLKKGYNKRSSAIELLNNNLFINYQQQQQQQQQQQHQLNQIHQQPDQSIDNELIQKQQQLEQEYNQNIESIKNEYKQNQDLDTSYSSSYSSSTSSSYNHYSTYQSSISLLSDNNNNNNKNKNKNKSIKPLKIYNSNNNSKLNNKIIIIMIGLIFLILSSILIPIIIIKFSNYNNSNSEYQFKLYQYNQYMEEGNKDYRLGLFGDALVSYKKALNISISLDSDQFILDSYQLIFDCVYNSGNYSEALEITNQYLQVEPLDAMVNLKYHQMRGRVYFNTGKLQPCIDERLLAIKYIKQLYQNQSNEEAYGEVQIGACYSEHGKYESAIQYYTIAFNIYQQMNDTYRDKYYYGFSLFHLGYAYFHSVNLTNYMQESFKYFNSSYQIGLELYHQDSNKYYIFLTDRQNYLGRWYIKQGGLDSLDLGFQFCRASESILRDKSQFNIPEMAETLYLLGQIERLRSNYKNALYYQSDSLNIRIEFYSPSGNLLRPSIAENYLEIGQDQMNLNNCTGAIYSMNKAKEVYNTFDSDTLIKTQLLIINNTIEYCAQNKSY